VNVVVAVVGDSSVSFGVSGRRCETGAHPKGGGVAAGLQNHQTLQNRNLKTTDFCRYCDIKSFT
jgi:hypothetical protein